MNKSVPDERIIKVLRKTRKAYLIEYFCGTILLILFLFAILSGKDIKSEIILLVAALSFTCFVYAEIGRIFTKYVVMPSKIVIVTGIIKQNKQHIFFHPLGFVTDINTKQSTIQRFLNYGTIYVKSGGVNAFEIKDINRPHRIMEMVEKLIEKNRGTGGPKDKKEQVPA